MDTHNKTNYYIAGVTTLAIFVVACICFDFTYYLNDDCMLESILSGQLSGSPSPMTYYMNVVLGAILALMYRLLPTISWLGVFMCTSILVCTYIIICTVLENLAEKKVAVMFAIAFIISIMFSNLVMPHYTVVAAIYCMTSIFCLITLKVKEDNKGALKSFAIVIILMLMGFMVRSNVFYMSLPFFVVAAIYKIFCDGASIIKRLVMPMLVFVAGFMLLFIADHVAYSSPEYKAYINYNNVRTSLYDYGYINTDPMAMDYYSENGLDETTVLLYKCYDMKLDAQNGIDVMNKLLAYDKNANIESGFNNSLYLYKEKLLKRNSQAVDSDYPYNYLVIALYLIILVAMLLHKDIKGIIYLVLLFSIRSGLWIYILHKGRYPERITISLYMLELAILCGILVLVGKELEKLSLSRAGVSIVLILFLVVAYLQMQALTTRYSQQISVNKEDDVLYSYMNAHSGLYLLDTYSVVNRTTKAASTYKERDNYMILGGWTNEHPLVDQRFMNLGFDGATDAIVSEGVYFVTARDVGMEPQLISEYLDCSYELVDTIEDRFFVYSFICR